MFKALVIMLLTMISVAGCTENYRYPCQNPDNWDSKQCKKPYCSANGTCPEDLQHYVKDRQGQPIIPPMSPAINNNKGECK